MNDKREIFSSVLPFFSKLKEGEKIALEQVSTFTKKEAGVILHAGKEDCSGLFVLKKGRIRGYMVTEDGKEITLFRLIDNEICIFSASCMMKNIRFDVWLLSETPVEYLLVPTYYFDKLSNENIYVSKYTNEILNKRMSDVMWVLEQMVFMSFDKRLANFLLEEYQLNKKDKLKITHEQIANHIGSAREVVSRMLKYFEGEGYVKLGRGSIHLVNIKGLEKI